jgi:hypothetical protein
LQASPDFSARRARHQLPQAWQLHRLAPAQFFQDSLDQLLDLILGRRRWYAGLSGQLPRQFFVLHPVPKILRIIDPGVFRRSKLQISGVFSGCNRRKRPE